MINDDKELECLLDKIFSNVNSWLNFAEAKNAANIALVIASIAAITNLQSINILLSTLCILLTLSGLCSLISFIPNLVTVNKKSKEHKDGNLLFFETIKKYSGIEYVEQINKLYFQINKKDFNKYQLDLADEIVYNSNITSYKYKLFKAAVYIDILTFMLFILCFIMA